MRKLVIIIPVFNQWGLTEACLQSLAKHTPGQFYEVVVVDNGSTDETPRHCHDLLKRLFPGRHAYLRQETNLAFGPACNLGAQATSADMVLFLNNDTEVTDGWVAPLFKTLLDDQRLGAVSPLLLYPDSRRVQHLGVVFDPNLHALHLYANFPEHHPAVRRPRPLQVLSAAALFMPRSLFLDCGGFHEGYRNGSEDLDLCCQLIRKGLRVTCVPESVVLHHTSRTEGRFDHVPQNAKLLGERCKGCFSSDLHRLARRDGFVVRLTRWLEPYLVGPVPGETDDDLEAQLVSHPLWEPGYTALVARLEAEGCHADALDWQELCAGFFPHVDHFMRAAKLAEEVGNAGRSAHWNNRLAHVHTMLSSQEKLVMRAKENQSWFHESGQEDMVRLYATWLEQNSIS